MSEAVPAGVVGKLRESLVAMKKSEIWAEIVEPRDQVFARFQPIFSPSYTSKLTPDEFRPFLYFEHNHHWTGLHRQVNRLCGQFPKLQQCLSVLLDETQAIEDRLDNVAGSVVGLGKGTITAILLMAYPDKYGVWNNTSAGALAALGIYPEFERGESFGSQYAQINGILRQLAQALQTDLWTLDALWWMIQQGDELPASSAGTDASGGVLLPSQAQRFGLERHLHDFLFDNWDTLDLGKEWAIYSVPGDPEAGYEYGCAVGRIDILAKHRLEKKWLVVELKRNDTSDSVIGQVLRYMGWVRKHLAEPGDEVHGLIIAREGDAALEYAMTAVPNVSFLTYEVEFRLKEPVSKLGGKEKV